MMQAYCSDKKLGEALESCHGSVTGELCLPAAVMRHRPKLAGEVTWHETERDEAIEIVVPLSVIEKLGKFVSAGQLAAVTSEYSAPVTHIARLVPAELCTSQMLSPEARSAFEIDEATCLTASGQEVALLSPMLAFNLGLPYFVTELTHGSELGAWLSKKNGIKIMPLASSIPKFAPEMTTAQAWEPGTARPELPAASHIGLAVISTPQKQAPFNIVEYQDSMQQALQAMQGGGAQKKAEEEAMEDTELDDLAAEEHKQRDSDTMQALQEFMTRPRFVCLGDMIALPVHSTPLLGPLLTKPGHKASSQDPAEDPEKSHYIVFLRVVELTCSTQREDNGTLTHAVLWPSKRSSFTEVMLSHCIASAFPVGAESFLLDSPPARDPPEAPSTPPLNPESRTGGSNEAEAENGFSTPKAVDKPSSSALAADSNATNGRTDEHSVRLGRSAYATLNPGIELHKGKLLCGAWKKIALQFAPNLHPSVKIGKHLTAGGALGRASVLVTGPERGGKAMEVSAAGKAIGLEVLEVDCRSLASGSPMDEAECVSHLTNIIHQARTMAPVIILFRRLERVFPQQPNMSVVKRFSDTLVSASQAFAAPHLPELQALPPPDNPPKPEDEIPLEDLPWNVLKAGVTAYHSSGAPAEPPGPSERLRLQALHARYPPGVLFVAATTSKPAEVPVPLRRAFTAEIEVPAAPEDQRARALTRMLGPTTNAESLDSDGMRSAAQSMAGFLPCDLAAMACDATLAVLREKISEGAGDVVEALQGSIGQKHIDGTLESVRQRTALDLGAPKIPAVAWKDVGGLEHVKKAILETIELPLKYRGLFASGMKRRSGVLLYGPPGTGKTLIAKAVATECSINFMSIKGPELINMYVGESEKNVREVFEKARKAQPCVLFFDELDSLAPRRGNGMDSSHVSDRIVAQILSELDGIGGGRSDVYIVGATNRPDLLDPALMRPGRLDVLLYVGVDRAPSSKLLVLQALTRKFNLKADVDLSALAERLPPQTTGADAYGLCADAWLIALRRRISELTASGRISKNSSSPDEAHDLDDVEVDVCMDDFGTALGNFAPSLTLKDLDKYDALQDQYAPDRGRKGAQIGSTQAPGQSDSEGSAASSTLKLRPKLPPRKKAAPIPVVQEEDDDTYL